MSHTTLQQTSSSDTTTISTTLYNRTKWHAPNSDHLPIYTTINTRTNYKLQQNRHTFTNSRKTNWTQFSTDTEAAFSDIQPPPNIHTANTIFILHTDKHNIPKSKIHSTCKLLLEHIRHKLTHRNNIRAQNTSDPSISELNSEITSLIQTHKSDIWREHLYTHWVHKHNTHTLWKAIDGLAKKTNQHNNNTITFKEKTFNSSTQAENAFNKHLTNIVKHKTHTTNRYIDMKTLKLQTTNITLTTTQVQTIKQSKNNNSTGPAKVNIRHFKHIGPLGLAYLTDMYNLVAVTDCGGANSRFLGLVFVGASRSLDQTALRPSVIKRIRQMTLNT